MVYLTRFRINTARRSARKLFTSPQAMHAAVLAGFADPPACGDGRPRVLWRLDGAGHDQVLYIASPGEPDLSHLVEQAGWPTTETWQTRKYADFLAALEAGQRWAFRLTANPVRNGRVDSRPGTRRLGHVTVDQQRQWLLSRAERAGFRLPKAATGEPDIIVHGRQTYSFPRDGGRVTLRVATFDGHLEVVDAEAFRTALTTGIGHAKAYGCGLMTLARPM
jgi:CRISPR system Cascade subunit CasE